VHVCRYLDSTLFPHVPGIPAALSLDCAHGDNLPVDPMNGDELGQRKFFGGALDINRVAFLD